MTDVTISHAGGRSRTMTGAIVVLLGGVLTMLGFSIPEEELGEMVNLALAVIGGTVQLIGVATAMYARYSRGDVTITGKKVADTKVEVTPPSSVP